MKDFFGGLCALTLCWLGNSLMLMLSFNFIMPLVFASVCTLTYSQAMGIVLVLAFGKSIEVCLK